MEDLKERGIKILTVGMGPGIGYAQVVAQRLAEMHMESKMLVMPDIHPLSMEVSPDIAGHIEDILVTRKKLESALAVPKVFKITRNPDLPEVFIDPNEPVINYKKHYQTCAKNRRKRKNKKKNR